MSYFNPNSAYFYAMKTPKNKRNTDGVVYSTSGYVPQEEQEETVTPEPAKQNLKIGLEKNHRGGKTVTIVRGFKGNLADLESLGKYLKSSCGTGGSVKDGEIILQGEIRQKVLSLLQHKGYSCKLSGG